MWIDEKASEWLRREKVILRKGVQSIGTCAKCIATLTFVCNALRRNSIIELYIACTASLLGTRSNNLPLPSIRRNSTWFRKNAVDYFRAYYCTTVVYSIRYSIDVIKSGENLVNYSICASVSWRHDENSVIRDVVNDGLDMSIQVDSSFAAERCHPRIFNL